MAYATTNPPQKISQGPGSAPALWMYTSADDDATVAAADYFSNGDDLGMRVNDVVIVNDTTTPGSTLHTVSAVTAGGAATVAAAILI